MSRRGRADDVRPEAIGPVGAEPTGAPPPVSAGPVSGRGAAFTALRHPRFRLFWIGAFVSNIGSWMQAVAQGWLVLELTDSAFMLGLVGFAATFPMLVLLLVGGVYADRFDRRTMLLWAMGAMMAFATALAVLTGTGTVRIQHVLVLSLLNGGALAMAAPAYQAFVHDLVGRPLLQNAIALNSAQFNLSRVVGPSIAGLAIGVIGLAGCFGLNAISYLAAIAVLVKIRGASTRKVNPDPVWKSLVEGVGYVRSRPRIQAVLLLVSLISVLAMPYATLLPIIARDSLGLGASGLGWLFAVGGTGAVVGALSLAAWRGGGHRGLYLLTMCAITGLGTTVLGLAREPLLAGAALVAISYAATSAIALSNTLLQELVDDAMRGRVLGMFGLAFMGTFPIGNLLSGSLAAWLSASTTLALTGGLLVAAVVLVAASRRRILEVE
ncbi:MAG TPA: MFS transporter [Gemmatimonadota bacterium]|nr:MFS transporter [Gemmatimonadota bacterium]